MASTCEICDAPATNAVALLRKHSVDVREGQRHIVWDYDGDPYRLRCDACHDLDPVPDTAEAGPVVDAPSEAAPADSAPAEPALEA